MPGKPCRSRVSWESIPHVLRIVCWRADLYNGWWTRPWNHLFHYRKMGGDDLGLGQDNAEPETIFWHKVLWGFVLYPQEGRATFWRGDWSRNNNGIGSLVLSTFSLLRLAQASATFSQRRDDHLLLGCALLTNLTRSWITRSFWKAEDGYSWERQIEGRTHSRIQVDWWF